MQNVTYSSDQLRGFNSTELRRAATSLGIKNSSAYKKQDLLAKCLETISPKTSKRIARLDLESNDIKQILESTVSKSEKMRQLSDLGMATIQIAEVTESRYSFVYTTLKNYKLKSLQRDLTNSCKSTLSEMQGESKNEIAESVNESAQQIISSHKIGNTMPLSDDDFAILADRMAEDIGEEVLVNAAVAKHFDPEWM